MFEDEYENIPHEFADPGADDDIYDDARYITHDEVNVAMQQREFEDDTFNDVDFSSFSGDNLKSSLHKINKKVEKKEREKAVKKKSKPVPRKGPIKPGKQVKIPGDKKVVIKGVSKFILDTSSKQGDEAKKLGYYKGEKLRHVTFTFNNSDSAVDFNLQLFDPSEMLDYLYATSLNLNDKIQVSGGVVSYSDILFNLLANPCMMINAQFTFSGAQQTAQTNQPLSFINKAFSGEQRIDPQPLALAIDPYQTFGTVVYFPIMEKLNRPFIPDGMDVIGYKILSGMTVTMTFFFRQKQLKRMLFPEARTKRVY